MYSELAWEQMQRAEMKAEGSARQGWAEGAVAQWWAGRHGRRTEAVSQGQTTGGHLEKQVLRVSSGLSSTLGTEKQVWVISIDAFIIVF